MSTYMHISILSASNDSCVFIVCLQIRPRYTFKRKEIRQGEYEVGVDFVPSLDLLFCCINVLANHWFLRQTIPVDVPNTTESYHTYVQRTIVADIKESVCRVPDSAFDGNVLSLQKWSMNESIV